jgi:formylglycine-generating enzyme required for sulfatase activity
MMKRKISARAIVRVAVPLLLLALLGLALSYPDIIPFLRIEHPKYSGIDTVPITFKPGLREVSFAMKKIPAGVSPRGCVDVPGKNVVASPFLLAETEVTGELWFEVYERAKKDGFIFYGKAFCGSDRMTPIEAVSWRDAIVWCNALSAQLSLTPAYYANKARTVPVNSVAELDESADVVYVKNDANGFRLPSSAEWEFAARYIDGVSWNKGSHPAGSKLDYFDQTWSAGYAVFDATSSSPVKSLSPTNLGLYDMSGNVWEWCFDRILDTGSTTAFDPEGKRVVRGGSWASNAYRLQIGGEFGSLPGTVERGQGFRVARSGW